MAFQVRSDLLQPPPLKEYPLTQYIWIGDEPALTVVIVDLSQFLDAKTYASLKETLRFLPRSELGSLIQKQVQPLVAADYYPIIKKSFIELFNQVNKAEAASRNLQPWDWEKLKMRALYQSNADNLVDQNSLAYRLSTAGLVEDAEASVRKSLMKQYESLPKLGDLGAEASRQAAIIGLMKQREYELVQKILDAYKSAKPEEIAVMTQPPSNLTTLVPALKADLTVGTQISNVLDENPVNITVPADYIPPAGTENPLLNLIRR